MTGEQQGSRGGWGARLRRAGRRMVPGSGFPVVQSDSEVECGAACLTMILRSAASDPARFSRFVTAMTSGGRGRPTIQSEAPSSIRNAAFPAARISAPSGAGGGA